MKITDSTTFMASVHKEASFAYRESATLEMAAHQDAPSAILSLSSGVDAKSYKDSILEYQKKLKEEADQKRQERELKNLQNMAQRMKTQDTGQFSFPQGADQTIKMLRRLLAALRGEEMPEEDEEPVIKDKHGTLDIRSARFQQAEISTFSAQGSIVQVGQPIQMGTNTSGTTWQRITATSGFYSESEYTGFETMGMVKTADGRTIDFHVELQLSRAFMSEINTLEVEDYIKTDPLIINLDNGSATVTDKKFFFDLDADGKEEEISFAGHGSGFLALDKNSDGKINDGSELFGTKSGDGFADLAQYDEDGNGWIDENDSVFHKLKIWTKDENGWDSLISLKKADVGAIYLGSTDTKFELKDASSHTNAEIRKTGIFLRESNGSAGTIQHVDLVV